MAKHRHSGTVSSKSGRKLHVVPSAHGGGEGAAHALGQRAGYGEAEARAAAALGSQFTEPAEAAGLSLGTEIEPGLRLNGTPEAVTELVGILLDNAVKYSEPGSAVALRLSREGAHILLRVQNRSAAPDRLSPHKNDLLNISKPETGQAPKGPPCVRRIFSNLFSFIVLFVLDTPHMGSHQRPAANRPTGISPLRGSLRAAPIA